MVAIGSSAAGRSDRTDARRARSTAARTCAPQTFPRAAQPRASRTRSARPASWRARSASSSAIDELAEALDARSARAAPRATTSTSTRSAACPTRSKNLAGLHRPRRRARRLGGSRRAARPRARRTAAGAASAPPARSGGAAAARPRTRSCAWAPTASSTVVTGAQDIGTGVDDGVRAGRGRGARAAARPRARRDRHRRATASTRRSRAARRRCPSVAPAVRAAAYDLRGQAARARRRRVRGLAGRPRASSTARFVLAGRRAARAARRGHRQARPGAARRHRLARPEPRRHARQHVRLPDRAGRGRRRDGRDRGRAHRRRARHRPRDRARCRRAARSRAACCRALGFALMEERVIDPTTGTVVNGEPRGLQAADASPTAPRSSSSSSTCPIRTLSTLGLKGLGEPPIVPDRARDRERRLPRDRRARARGSPITRQPLPRGARRMSAYVRPATLDEALALLARRRRARRSPAAPTSCRCSARGKAAGDARRRARACSATRSSATGDGLVIGAATRVADVGRRRRASPSATPRCTQAARPAASPQLRNSGHRRRQPRPARALLVLPPPRPDLLAGGRRHLLRADRRPPQARARGRRLHLGRALRPRRRARSRSTRRVRVTGAGGERSVADRRALRAPERGPPLVRAARARRADHGRRAARRRPDASAYERAGERAAWSFALTGIAAARFGDTRAPGRDRRSRTSRACSTRPIRCAGLPGPRADGLEARARRRAVRARARARRARDNPRREPPTTSP